MNALLNKWRSLAPKTQGMIYLIIAVILELTGEVLLRYSEACTVLWATVSCGIVLFVCFVCYAKAIVNFNLGIAYALWSGIGILFLAIVSVAVFHQALNMIDLVGLALIVIGIVVMNVFGANDESGGKDQDGSAGKD